jgi:hypothetical protein
MEFRCPGSQNLLILSTYGRNFDAGSLGTKSNIAKTSCGFVRLDLKFEKLKAERECLLLSCLVLWELSKDRFFQPHGRQGCKAIDYKFCARLRVLVSYHTRTSLGESKSNRPRDYEILPLRKLNEIEYMVFVSGISKRAKLIEIWDSELVETFQLYTKTKLDMHM